jgi:small subunit ribosomal protein S16
MVRIRLRRIGLKGQPTYRIVAADKESPRDGRFLEILGFYNPRTDPATIHVKEDRVYHWMKNGALPSESVGKILKAPASWIAGSASKRASLWKLS